MLLGKSTAKAKRLRWLAFQVWYFGLQYYNCSIYFFPQLFIFVLPL